MNGYSLPVRATSVKKNSFFVRVMKKQFFYEELPERNKDLFSLSVQRLRTFSASEQPRKREGNQTTPAASMPMPPLFAPPCMAMQETGDFRCWSPAPRQSAHLPKSNKKPGRIMDSSGCIVNRMRSATAPALERNVVAHGRRLGVGIAASESGAGSCKLPSPAPGGTRR